jgi:hypothetical protein
MAGRKGEKWWSDAIKLAITERLEGDETGRTKLRAAADVLVAKALEGDVAALKEIGDRLDGKPQQAVDVTGAIEVRAVEVTFVSTGAKSQDG